MWLSWESKAKLYTAGWILNFLLFLSTAFFTWMASEPVKLEPKAIAAEHKTWDRDYWKGIAWGMGCLSAIQTWAMANLRPPWVQESIKKILDAFRDQLFLQEVDQPVDYNKVTLFQHCKRSRWRFWCKERGLGSFARSGHVEPFKPVWWSVENSPDIGVAGRCWNTKIGTIAVDLPDLKSDASEDDIVRYAATSFVSKEWVRNRIAEEGRRPLARSIRATMIEVDNNPWGVLVIDSRLPDIPKPTRVPYLLPCVANVLSTLLYMGRKR